MKINPLFIVLLANGCGSDAPPPPTLKPNVSSLCDQSFEELKAVDDALTPITGERTALPSKDQYDAICTQLPPSAAKCLGIQYQFEHKSDCEKTWSALPDKDRAALQKLANLPETP